MGIKGCPENSDAVVRIIREITVHDRCGVRTRMWRFLFSCSLVANESSQIANRPLPHLGLENQLSEDTIDAAALRKSLKMLIYVKASVRIWDKA